MSIDHHERVKGIVKAALKEASLGEPFGFAVSPPAFWPFLDAEGKVVGQGPAWFVTVSIRATGVGQPDIFNGFPVPGLLPTDDEFRTVARGLLNTCVQQRSAQDAAVIQSVGEGPSMKLSERPA